MIRGETVIVHRFTASGVDGLNNPVGEWADEHVDNVLVGPPNGANATDSTRPDGVEISMSLYFPRSYSGPSLRGCEVTVRGRRYTVVGDPQPLDGGITPTGWNMQVDVTGSEG